MSEPKNPAELAIKRIHLFFPAPAEEKIALALTAFWAVRAGDRIQELHPDLRMSEVLDLAHDRLWTTPEFSQMLELAGIDSFDEQFEQMTFREFVRYAAARSSDDAR